MGGYYVICKLATLIVTVMCSCNGLCTVHGFVKRNKNSSGDETANMHELLRSVPGSYPNSLK